MTNEQLVGWNEAIEAAAKVVESEGCGECDYMAIYARKIRALNRSPMSGTGTLQMK